MKRDLLAHMEGALNSQSNLGAASRQEPAEEPEAPPQQRTLAEKQEVSVGHWRRRLELQGVDIEAAGRSFALAWLYEQWADEARVAAADVNHGLASMIGPEDDYDWDPIGSLGGKNTKWWAHKHPSWLAPEDCRLHERPGLQAFRSGGTLRV